ncbi:LamG domain-containing protein [Candidatus Woesearchaeota archaeon]|nr:LamG domain-containing protein [Candidatus Woesearchaeota archaeon]
MARIQIFGLIVLFLSLFAHISIAAPVINYENPTPSHNSYTNTNQTFQINISLIESALGQLIYNWNATQPTTYEYYSHSLLLMLNLNNRSTLSENTTYIHDASIHNLTSVSSGIINYTNAGRYASALDLDGVDDKINISNSINLTGRNLTASFWMKRDTVKSCGGIVGKGDFTTSKGFAIYEGQGCGGSLGQLKFLIGNGSTFDAIYSRTALTNNQWYHVTFRFDGNFSIFIDGVIENNTATSVSRIADDPSSFYLGVTSWNGAQFYDGIVDDVRIWNRSLTNQEIYQEFTSNFERFNQTQWYLFINQSKNATNELTNGTYLYTFNAYNNLNALGSLETRVIHIGGDPALVPEWNDIAILMIMVIVVSGFFYQKKQENAK